MLRIEPRVRVIGVVKKDIIGMKVKELMTILETADPEHQVIIRYDMYAHRSIDKVDVEDDGVVIEAEV